jgi:hypothetical protein
MKDEKLTALFHPSSFRSGSYRSTCPLLICCSGHLFLTILTLSLPDLQSPDEEVRLCLPTESVNTCRNLLKRAA